MSESDSGRQWRLVVTAEHVVRNAAAMEQLRHAGYICTAVPGSPLSAEELAVAWADADAALIDLDEATSEAIAAARQLKIIARFGAGVDTVDIEAATECGIPVTICPGANSIAVAEYTLLAALVLARGMTRRSVEGGEGPCKPRRELAGKTIGVVGYGRIGRRVADYFAALGCQVLVNDPNIDPREMQAGSETHAVSFPVLLSRADLITIHCALTATTRDLVDNAAITQMKEGVLLINTARAGIVNEEALLGALRTGRVGGAALDVHSYEQSGMPLPESMRSCRTLIMTSHCASQTTEAVDRVSKAAVRSLCDFRRGILDPNIVVNPKALSTESRG